MRGITHRIKRFVVNMVANIEHIPKIVCTSAAGHRKWLGKSKKYHFQENAIDHIPCFYLWNLWESMGILFRTDELLSAGCLCAISVWAHDKCFVHLCQRWICPQEHHAIHAGQCWNLSKGRPLHKWNIQYIIVHWTLGKIIDTNVWPTVVRTRT